MSLWSALWNWVQQWIFQWLWMFKYLIQLGGHWLPLRLHQSPDPTIPLRSSLAHLGEISLETILLYMFSRVNVSLPDKQSSTNCSQECHSWYGNLNISQLIMRWMFILIIIGVFLFLKGNVIMNNSIVFFTEIGETYYYPDIYVSSRVPLTPPTSLQCITDKIQCCFSLGRDGWWYFPDGSEVYLRLQDSLYRDRGDDGSVNLNWRNDAAMSPNAVGLYCCKLPDARGTYHTLCANIGNAWLINHASSV